MMMRKNKWQAVAVTVLFIFAEMPCALAVGEETRGELQKKSAQEMPNRPRISLPFPEAAPAGIRNQIIPEEKKTAASGMNSGNEPEGQKKKTSADYVIQTGDRLNIKIYPEDDYVKGGVMQVSSEGTVTIPLVGKVAVGGKMPVAVEKELAKMIDVDYLVNPEVVVEIMEYASKSINKRTVIALGQIRKPGTYDVPPEKDKITLLELISMAGGFTEIANVKKIKIIHKRGLKKEVTTANGEAIISGNAPDVDLEPGDVVNVAESVF